MSFRILDGNAQAQPTASFAWAQSSYSVQEDAGSVVLTVTRSESAGSGSVDYATADGTAEAGVDYTAASGTVQFADGETAKTVSVPVLNDSIYRGDRYFTATLSNATGTLGSPTLATVTVQEDEQDPNAVTSEGSLTKILVSNEDTSDVQQGQVYTFGSPIEPGAVPAGWSVEVRHNGVAIAYQMDGECRHHPDGSLNFATFAAELPALAAGETTFLELVSKNAAKPTGSVAETSLTNADYSVALKVAGTEYTASLNDAVSVGDVDVERDGPVCKRYRAHRAMRDSGNTQHAHLWVRFYASAFSDGTTEVMAQVIGGHIDAAANTTYTDLELRSGQSVIRTMMPTWQPDTEVWEHSYVQPTTPNGFVYEAGTVGGGRHASNGSTEPSWPTTPGESVADGNTTWYCREGVTLYVHSAHSLADADGSPYRDGSVAKVHHRMDRGYITKARAWYAYYDLPVSEDAKEITYCAGAHGDTTYGINAGGDGSHIGYLTNWSTKALIAQTPGNDRRDRINALSWMDAPFLVYEPTGRLPVMIGTDFTADGMEASRPDDAWYAINTIPRDGTPWNTVDGTHNPQTAYYQVLKTGAEWFRDTVLAQANNIIGVSNPAIQSSTDYPGYTRGIGKKSGSGNWLGVVYRSEPRALGWNLRDLECAHWITPDAMPENGYVGALRDANLGYLEDLVTHLNGTPWAALGAYADATGNNKVWQSAYQACGVLLMYWHGGQKAKAYSDYHFIQNLFGQAIDGHPYWYGSYQLIYDVNGSIAQSWSEVNRGNGDPFLPQGEEKPYSLGDGINQVQYAVIALGAARFAQTVARDAGDEPLLDYATKVAAYVEQVVQYNDPVSKEAFAGTPKYRIKDFLPLDYGPDALADVLAGLSEGQWSSNIALNTIRDVAVTKDGANGSFSDYYGVEGKPNPQVTSEHWFAFSSGDLNPETVEYGFTGGGHDDHLDSSFYKFDFKTLKWRKTDDSAKYVEGEQDPTMPIQSTSLGDYEAWRSADGSFAPAASHTYGNVVYMPWVGGWFVYGAAVYRSGQGDPGGAVIVDGVTGQYQERWVWPKTDGARVVSTDSMQFAIPDAFDSGNNAYVPIILSMGNRDAYAGDPLEKNHYGRVGSFWSELPEPGAFGTLVPDDNNPGYRMYVAFGSDPDTIIYLEKVDDIPATSVRFKAFASGNTRPSGVTRAARWLYLGEYISGSDLILVAQPLTQAPGIALYTLSTVDWTWSGPISFTGSIPPWVSQDSIYWRRFIYIPKHDCFAVLYREAGADDSGEIHVMKRPQALA